MTPDQERARERDDLRQALKMPKQWTLISPEQWKDICRLKQERTEDRAAIRALKKAATQHEATDKPFKRGAGSVRRCLICGDSWFYKDPEHHDRACLFREENEHAPAIARAAGGK